MMLILLLETDVFVLFTDNVEYIWNGWWTPIGAVCGGSVSTMDK